MTSYYTIVRYVPDPVADERMNVGVLVLSNGQIRVRFIRHWDRAAKFGAEDIQFLREFASEVTHVRPVNEAVLKTMAERWKNSIQLSELRSSVKSPDELLTFLAHRFLREEQITLGAAGEGVRRRTKSIAVALGFRAIRTVVARHFGRDRAKEIVKSFYELQGSQKPHHFDIVVANSRPFFAAEAISFELEDERKLNRDLDAVAFAIDDVRQKDAQLPLAVIAIPPTERQQVFELANRIFSALQVPLIPNTEAEQWAEQHLPTLPLFDETRP